MHITLGPLFDLVQQHIHRLDGHFLFRLLNGGKVDARQRSGGDVVKSDLSEFLTLCRAGGWFDLSQLETVVFEHNGNLSFLPREAYRAAQPTDLSLSPKQSVLMTPVIMDGEVLPENLRSVGKDEVWLTRKLREQGYSAFGEVFLALCDGSGEAPQLYPIETKKTPREDGK